MISGIVLAAGMASRFGSTKQIVEIDGKPLVQHAVDVAAAAELDEIVVVLGHDAERVREALRLPENGRVVLNQRFAEGQSTSLASGLRALHPESDAAVVLLSDQLGVQPEEIQALIGRFGETQASILRLRYRNAPGPALLSKAIWPEALGLMGDIGARALFERQPVENVTVSRQVPADVDRVEDIRSETDDE